MSIISQNSENEVAVSDCVQRFFSSHKIGSLLKMCSGTKEKGVSAVSLLRYKLSGYTGALKAPVRCFGNHLSGKGKSSFQTDNECSGAAILKK